MVLGEPCLGLVVSPVPPSEQFHLVWPQELYLVYLLEPYIVALQELYLAQVLEAHLGLVSNLYPLLDQVLEVCPQALCHP